MLKRLSISWDLPEEQLVAITTEVEAWLHGQEETPVSVTLAPGEWQFIHVFVR